VKPVFDAFRNLDLACASQQFRRTHFAHVHAHRIGGAAEFGVDGRKRDFRFLISLVVRYGSGGRVVQEQRFRVGRLLVHRYTHVIERADNSFDRRSLREVVGQVIIDFRVGQVAAFLAQLDECAHLKLALSVLQRHGRGVHRQQDRDCLALRRAPTRSFPRGCGRVGY